MSVKKKASGRRSVQVEDELPGNTQSAAARRSAEAELRTLTGRFAPAHSRLIVAMRRSLRKRLPTAHEVVYEYRDSFVISYSPNERGYEGVLAIRAGANGVKLYFNRGKDLPDPAKLLQGSGQTRSIDLEGASKLARPAVARPPPIGLPALLDWRRTRQPAAGSYAICSRMKWPSSKTANFFSVSPPNVSKRCAKCWPPRAGRGSRPNCITGRSRDAQASACVRVPVR